MSAGSAPLPRYEIKNSEFSECAAGCLLEFAFVCASDGHPTRGGRVEGTNCWSEGGCGRLMRATSSFWAHKFVCLI